MNPDAIGAAELLPLSDNEPDQQFTTELLADGAVRAIVENYRSSSFPVVVLDSALRIVWVNSGYLTLFGRERAKAGLPIIQPFRPYLDESKSAEVAQRVRSREAGFAWRGRVEASGTDFRTVIANLLISPIGVIRESLPRGYIGIFDVVTEEIRSLLRGTFMSLLEASSLKDDDTGKHIERVNEYSLAMAQELRRRGTFPDIDPEFVENISFLAAMHDVGKIGTPDNILHKAGPLTDWEWDIMKEHTINGAYILSTYPNKMAREIALFHHEWWDGRGYPYQLTGTMIPLPARIVAVSDVYDALRMKRSYKEAYSHERAMEEILKGAGSHFDPAIVEGFATIEEKFRAIFDRLNDTPSG